MGEILRNGGSTHMLTETEVRDSEITLFQFELILTRSSLLTGPWAKVRGDRSGIQSAIPESTVKNRLVIAGCPLRGS